MADYYSILGLSKGASTDEVKAAFRKAALQWHPDRHASGDALAQNEAASRFKAVSEAYEVLGDENKRALYDIGGRAGVRRAGSTPASAARARAAAEADLRRYRAARDWRTFFRIPRMSRLDLALQGGMVAAGMLGFVFASTAGESMWESRNAGRTFEDARGQVEAARRERAERLRERRAQEIMDAADAAARESNGRAGGGGGGGGGMAEPAEPPLGPKTGVGAKGGDHWGRGGGSGATVSAPSLAHVKPGQGEAVSSPLPPLEGEGGGGAVAGARGGGSSAVSGG